VVRDVARTVLDDVAYFGISKWGSRRERDDVKKTSEARAPSAPRGMRAARPAASPRGAARVERRR
jgi:hypothetical protein